MSSNARRRAFSVIVSGCIVSAFIARPAESQVPQHSPSSAADPQPQAELARLFASLSSDTSSHMRMGPTRAATTADSARAADIVRTARAALGQYVDVKIAERDGYYRNLPQLEEQVIYHYNSLRNFSETERGEFDVAKPVSLLYKKDDRGQLRLVGAMYATRASAAPEELDALLPTSMAQWHEHVNLCYPNRVPARPGAQKIDAGVVFWFRLFFSITSAKECESAGGRFLPVEFGWMAHVYMFAGSDDPKMIWGADDLGNMDMHRR